MTWVSICDICRHKNCDKCPLNNKKKLNKRPD